MNTRRLDINQNLKNTFDRDTTVKTPTIFGRKSNEKFCLGSEYI